MSDAAPYSDHCDPNDGISEEGAGLELLYQSYQTEQGCQQAEVAAGYAETRYDGIRHSVEIVIRIVRGETLTAHRRPHVDYGDEYSDGTATGKNQDRQMYLSPELVEPVEYGFAVFVSSEVTGHHEKRYHSDDRQDPEGCSDYRITAYEIGLSMSTLKVRCPEIIYYIVMVIF